MLAPNQKTRDHVEVGRFSCCLCLYFGFSIGCGITSEIACDVLVLNRCLGMTMGGTGGTVSESMLCVNDWYIMTMSHWNSVNRGYEYIWLLNMCARMQQCTSETILAWASVVLELERFGKSWLCLYCTSSIVQWCNRGNCNCFHPTCYNFYQRHKNNTVLHNRNDGFFYRSRRVKEYHTSLDAIYQCGVCLPRTVGTLVCICTRKVELRQRIFLPATRHLQDQSWKEHVHTMARQSREKLHKIFHFMSGLCMLRIYCVLDTTSDASGDKSGFHRSCGGECQVHKLYALGEGMHAFVPELSMRTV